MLILIKVTYVADSLLLLLLKKNSFLIRIFAFLFTLYIYSIATITLQHIKIIVRDAGFEPRTTTPCGAKKPPYLSFTHIYLQESPKFIFIFLHF